MKRKKWLFQVLITLMVFATSTASAQFRFAIKGGVNVATVKFNKDVLQSDNVTGFHLGPMVEGMFGNGGVGMDLAILYSQKGFNTDMVTVKNDYIEVPLNIKFKLGLPLLNPYVAVGPYVAFRVAGDKKWNIQEKTREIINQVEAQNFGAGVNFSTGLEVFNRLQVGLTYSIGLTDDYKTFDKSDADSYKGKLHTWYISAVLFF